MTKISIIEVISNLYTTALTDIFKHVYTVASDTIGGYLPFILTLYIGIMGYLWMIGEMGKGKKNFFRVFILLPILITFVFQYKLYLDFFTIPILVLKDYMINYISEIASNSNDQNTFLMLDGIYWNLFAYIENELMGSFTINPLDVILGTILIIIYGLLYIWTAFFMIASLVFTSFFLMIGPIPLILFAFDSTQSITYSWIRAVSTYFLYGPISAFFMIFTYWITKNTVADIDTTTEYIFLLIASGGILIQFTRSIPELVNSITGSMSHLGDATSGVFKAAQWGSIGAKRGASATVLAAKKVF